jgi:hypothetical protein
MHISSCSAKGQVQEVVEKHILISNCDLELDGSSSVISSAHSLGSSPWPDQFQRNCQYKRLGEREYLGEITACSLMQHLGSDAAAELTTLGIRLSWFLKTFTTSMRL